MYFQFHSDGLDARTIKAHERHIANLSGAAHDSVTTTYGVNRDSILNDLEYFHVTSGLPPDVMHDIFEGVAVVEIKCMLSVFIQKMNLLSLNALNDRIKHFPFGLTDSKSKPLPLPLTFFSVSGSDSLKQSCELICKKKINLYLYCFFSLTNMEFDPSFTLHHWRLNSRR